MPCGTASWRDLLVSALVIAAIAALLWFFSPSLVQLGNAKIILFLVVFVAVVPRRRRAHRFLLRHRHVELSRFRDPGSDLRHDRTHGRGHVGHHPPVGADLRPAGLHSRCHRHGQGDHRLPRLAARPRPGRHVLRAARLALRGLRHFRLEGLRHGHRRAGARSRR